MILKGTARRIEELSAQLDRINVHEGERHRFRHQMGQFAAQQRLDAYMNLAHLASEAYRARIGKDWNDQSEMEAARRARQSLMNFFYDHWFFFASDDDENMERAVKNLNSALKVDFPDRDGIAVVEENLRRVYNCVRRDLLLKELADSASRAVEAAAAAGADQEITMTSV